MDKLPELPKQISNDGREIWDWAGKLSEHMHRQNKMAELQKRIRNDAGEKCGGCNLWMTSACPSEKHNNQTGRRSGPHMNMPRCGKYSETVGHTQFREKLKAELAALTANNGEQA